MVAVSCGILVAVVAAAGVSMKMCVARSEMLGPCVCDCLKSVIFPSLVIRS